jgi:hypothetical protein
VRIDALASLLRLEKGGCAAAGEDRWSAFCRRDLVGNDGTDRQREGTRPAMNAFPVVDPIPLPAPVWLFKALHVLTLALHFISVELLLGGLLVATWLNFYGASRRQHAAAALRLNASAALARRLPVVMTYVINLGVPPLLFAQVLYGRALYTSSVLIGFYWIAVVFLLMGCYWVIYRFAAGTEQGRAVWWQGLLAWLLAASVAKIYSTNMTLMLRPEVWGQMYSTTASGIHLPPSDATLMPRWLFMLAGGLWVAGVWMIWLAGRRSFEDPCRRYLAANGGWLAVGMLVVQGLLASKVLSSQPETVRQAMATHPVYRIAGLVWLASAALVLVFGLWAAARRPTSRPAGWVGVVLLLVVILSMTLYRDGIRDLTLLGKGLDVWDRKIVTNWSVVGLFLGLFVAGLGGLGWLISVMVRARPVSEKVA